MKLVALSGSPSRQSKTAKLIDYVFNGLAIKEIETKKFSVYDFLAEDILYGRFSSEGVRKFQKDVLEADALLIATPVYKAAYAGTLKLLLDIIPEGGLEGKPVMPLVSGGSLGHMLAVDYTLKPVLASLKASEIHQGVFAVDSQIIIREDGQVVLTDDLKYRLDKLTEDLISALKVDVGLKITRAHHEVIAKTISL